MRALTCWFLAGLAKFISHNQYSGIEPKLLRQSVNRNTSLGIDTNIRRIWTFQHLVFLFVVAFVDLFLVVVMIVVVVIMCVCVCVCARARARVYMCVPLLPHPVGHYGYLLGKLAVVLASVNMSTNVPQCKIAREIDASSSSNNNNNNNKEKRELPKTETRNNAMVFVWLITKAGD